MKNVTAEFETSQAENLPARPAEKESIRPLALDVKRYESHLEEFDLTEEQKRELLETLWSIMTAFVDLGFGVDAVQCVFRDQDADSFNAEGSAVKNKDRSPRFNRIAQKGKEDR